jgi:CrcB protein
MAGGAIGSYLRYAVSGLSYRLFDWTFPVGTLVVNSVGSFIIGFLWAVFEDGNLSASSRAFLFVGILGGFTTFSTYMLETLNLMRDGETRLALYNLVGSNIVGLVMVVCGFVLARWLLARIRTL